MMAESRSFTVLIQRDGALTARTFRVPVWKVRASIVAAATFGVLLVTAVAIYAPIYRAAARLPALQHEVARLKGENARILELSAAVDSLERRYGQVRKMIGADIVPDPVRYSASLPVAPPIRAVPHAGPARFTPNALPPHYWPLDESGFITRGQVGDTAKKEELHPGIDIAVPVGSIVRAAGGGAVAETGQDPEYGSFVLLQHPDSFQTMYGHLSRRLVAVGDSVQPGQVIGLTGNSGRSSAPHLHFEIRRQGVSLDPLTMVKEGRQ
jgi:murein DD-endopeptidase MepM/ murein hydrolase activator NlpD